MPVMLSRVLVVTCLLAISSAALALDTGFVDANALNVRTGPGTTYQVVRSISKGTRVTVVAYSRNRNWCSVSAGNIGGWVTCRYLKIVTGFAPSQEPKGPAQTFNCTIPIPTLKDQMIRESIAKYQGSCPCNYSTDKAGNRCGGRSAWSRPGGASPLCRPSDISDDAVREFCQVLTMRGQGG